MYVSINGIIVEENRAQIPAVTDGLFYGAGCFETLKSYNSSFLHFEKHVDRLNAGIKYLTRSTDIYYPAGGMRKEVIQYLEANNLADEDAVVRIQASINNRTGYKDSEESNILRIITSTNIKPVNGTHKLATSDINVVPSSCRPPHLKLSNMLHYREAAIDAKNKGFDDALMLTVNSDVAETSIGNLFWEYDGDVYTPSAECDILPGIMRSIVINLLKKMDIPVKSGRYDRSRIMKSRQVWMTNSVREIVQISKIDDQNFSTETELFIRLKNEILRYKKENLR